MTELIKKTKKTVFLARYKKTMLFGYWMSKKMSFTSEQQDKFEELLQMYSSVDEKNSFYKTFDNEMEEMKEEVKILNEIVKEDRKSYSKRAIKNEERDVKRIKVTEEEEEEIEEEEEEEEEVINLRDLPIWD
jgi:type I site-specific restriction-modification system R (restriction) subunit